MFILISANDENFSIYSEKFDTLEKAQTQMKKEFDDIVDDGETDADEFGERCAIVQVDGFSTWWSIDEF